MKDRNVALDRDGEVWAQGEFTDLWRCLTSLDHGSVDYNTMVAERGPVRTLEPAVEKYRPVR